MSEGTGTGANVSVIEGTNPVANLPVRERTDVDMVIFQIQELLFPVVACEFPVVVISDSDDGFTEATDAASGAAAPIDACRRRNGRHS
jgi:hypothetical protein